MNRKLIQHAAITSLLLTTSVFTTSVFAEQVSIRFATWDNEASAEIQQQIVNKFEAANPDIRVQFEPYSSGFDQKLTAAFGAKVAPDVIYVWDFPRYRADLEPLNTFIERDKVKINYKDIPDGLTMGATMNGQIYGIPVGFTTHVMFYNKDLFKKAGVPYPSDNWSWDTLTQDAIKLRNKQDKIFGYAVSAKPDPFDFEQFLWSNGTSYISNDGKTIEGYMNSPQSVEVFDMFTKMIKNDSALVSDIGTMGSATELFKSGKLAIYEGAMWDLADIRKSKVNLGIAPLPTFNGHPAHSSVNISAIAITKDSKQKEAAWKFIQFYLTDEAIKMRTADLPVRMSVAKELGYDKDPQMKVFYEMLAQSNKYQPAFLTNKNWSRIQSNLAFAIESTFLLKGTPKENLDEAVKKSHRFLK